MAREGKTTGSDPQARLAAAVVIVTFPAWLGLTWLGGRLGWDPSYAFLADFSALAAFAWALVVLFQVWRKRQQNKDE